MYERLIWPNWLKNIMPNWLEDIDYPAPGVGDQNDLNFTLGVGANGRWVGFVNSGWFYHENLEQYNYVSRGVAYVAATSGTPMSPLPGYTVSAAVSGVVSNSISWRPSWGPVLVSSYVSSGSTNNFKPYTFHNNSFWPGISLTWNASGALYWANVPASSVLVGLRDLTNLSMGSVAATGHILSEKLFYYDRNSNRVWVKPKVGSTPQCWADIVYFEPILKFREAVTYSSSGLQASYKNIESITAQRGNQIVSFAGSVSGGFFTPAVTGVYPGDWVILEYFIKDSFILKDHKTLHYYTTASTSGQHFQIYHETSIPDLIPAVNLNLPTSGELNFNPLFADSFRAGFLFHANPASSINSYWTPKELKIEVDKLEVCHSFKEPLKVTINLFGNNGLPLGHYPINVNLTANASTLVKTPPGSAWVTDGRGEIHAIIAPQRITHTFTVSGTVSSLSAIATSQVTSFDSWMDKNRWQEGNPTLVITQEKKSDGSFRSFAGVTSLDGIPRAAPSGITILTEKPSQINLEDKSFQQAALIYPKQTSDPNSLGAWVEFGLLPQEQDNIVVKNNFTQGNIFPAAPNNDV